MHERFVGWHIPELFVRTPYGTRLNHHGQTGNEPHTRLCQGIAKFSKPQRVFGFAGVGNTLLTPDLG